MEYANSEVVAIANKQKVIIWLMLASLVALVYWPLQLVVAIVQIVFVFKLAKALKLNTPWVWAACMIIPLVGIILLLVLNDKATKAIRHKGVKVGLMGASRAQLDKLTVTT